MTASTNGQVDRAAAGRQGDVKVSSGGVEQAAAATAAAPPATTERSGGNARWYDGVHSVLSGRPAWSEANEEALLAPFTYLDRNPGHGVRSQLIDTFDWWLKVPNEKLVRIDRIVTMAHTSSLMIDDIEDGSELRRGRPAAHMAFGTPLTINAANYVYFLFFAEMISMVDLVVPGHRPLMTSDEVQRMLVEEMLNLHRGQGIDLYWRDNFVCPTEEEYVSMVNNKTGGLFRVVLKLMISQSTTLASAADGDALVSLVNLIGLVYQIRDDYMNLRSGDYTQNKGYCEDLSEGKFSFPIIHALAASKALDAGTAPMPKQQQQRKGKGVLAHAHNTVAAARSACAAMHARATVAAAAAAAATADMSSAKADAHDKGGAESTDSVRSTLDIAAEKLAGEVDKIELERKREDSVSTTRSTRSGSLYDSPLSPSSPQETCGAYEAIASQDGGGGGASSGGASRLDSTEEQDDALTIRSHADFVAQLRSRPADAREKRAIVQYMERVTDSFTYTCDVMLRIDQLMRQELCRMERHLDGGRRNEQLRAYVDLLRSGWYGLADCPPIDAEAQQTPSPSVEVDLSSM